MNRIEALLQARLAPPASPRTRPGPTPIDPDEALAREVLLALGIPRAKVNAVMNPSG